MSQQVCLRFYTHENRKLHGILLYEWLLENARKHDVHGGSAFRAIAGYGRHGGLHEQHFFELAGDVPVVVEFLLTAEEAEAMLVRLRYERISVFYTRIAAEFGVLQGDA
jgi:PII-like signaling protein